MEVFCTIAGLVFPDLKERLGEEIPNRSSSRWGAGAIAAAFSVVDRIVRGTESAEFAEGAIPLRPVELLLNGDPGGGWAEIEQMRVSGVPYEWAPRPAHRWQRLGCASQPYLVNTARSRRLTPLCGAGPTGREIPLVEISFGGTIRATEVHRLVGGGAHIGVGCPRSGRQPDLGGGFLHRARRWNGQKECGTVAGDG